MSDVKANRRNALQMIASVGLLGGAAGIGLYRHREALSDLLPEFNYVDAPAAVLFVTDDTVALSRSQGGSLNSFSVRDWCMANNVEYRKYRKDSDMFQVREWVRDMHEFGVKFGAPCMVTVDRDGRGRAYRIPEGSAKTIELLKKVMA